jgi:hypothetical protein
MAMTGLRVVTTRSGLLGRTPPQTITDQAAPVAIAELPQKQRELVTELAHWGYGAAAGAVYGSLPCRLGSRSWAGPAYGVVLWLFFEVAIAPALKLEYARERQVAWRAMVILDHLLYGVIVSDRLAPEPSRSQAARAVDRFLEHRKHSRPSGGSHGRSIALERRRRRRLI